MTTRPTETPNDWIPSPSARAWLYLAGAIAALLALYGILNAEQVDGWTRVLHAIVYLVDAGALGLAARNIPRGGRHAA